MAKKKRKQHATSIIFKSFTVVTTRPNTFMKELDRLCTKHEIENGTFYNYGFE